MNEIEKARASGGWVFGIGPLLFFVAACAYGMLEVHSSTDTWIGLAAGRQIVELGHVPKTDSFSFTFPGQHWYNQNWGTHLAQYWVYSHFGPDAVIHANWSLIAATALLFVFACWKRTANLPASLIAASIAILGFRDYASARPATTGYFCMAALSAILCALESPWQKNRWLPIAAIPIVLMAWGCVPGLYVICWLLSRVIKPSLHLTTVKHISGIVVGVALALLLTLLLGPFGMDNFTHGEKVASSETFRGVSEWRPPTATEVPFPPVWRFWLILSVSLVAILGAFAARAISAGFSTDLETKKEQSFTKLHLNFFDFLPLLIGLGMTFWARRFGPVFYIFSAPVLLVVVLRVLPSLSSPVRLRFRLALSLGCLFAVALLAGAWNSDWVPKLFGDNFGQSLRRLEGETLRGSYNEIRDMKRQYPESSLLERVTHYTQSPTDSIDYLKKNELAPNLLIEWTQAGISMFDWPQAKVFMDGRAQQLYDEATYIKYIQIIAEYNMYPSEAQAREAAIASLESAGEIATTVTPRPRVDAVLLRMGRAAPLNDALENSTAWVLVYYSTKSALFVRRDSDPFRAVTARIAEKREWRPDTAEALLCLGKVLLAAQPPDFAGALAANVESVKRSPALARLAARSSYACFRQLGRIDEGIVYFEELKARFEKPIEGMSDADRRNAVLGIQNFINTLKQQTTSVPTIK